MVHNITLILQHGGKFIGKEDDRVEYVGGEINVWEDFDLEKLNLFILNDLVKYCTQHDNVGDVYWLVDKGKDFKTILRMFTCDPNDLDMIITSRHNGDEVKLYLDPSIDDNIVVLGRVDAVIKENEEDDDNLIVLGNIPNAKEKGYDKESLLGDEDLVGNGDDELLGDPSSNVAIVEMECLTKEDDGFSSNEDGDKYLEKLRQKKVNVSMIRRKNIPKISGEEPTPLANDGENNMTGAGGEELAPLVDDGRNNISQVSIKQQVPLEDDGRNNLSQVSIQEQILMDHIVGHGIGHKENYFSSLNEVDDEIGEEEYSLDEEFVADGDYELSGDPPSNPTTKEIGCNTIDDKPFFNEDGYGYPKKFRQRKMCTSMIRSKNILNEVGGEEPTPLADDEGSNMLKVGGEELTPLVDDGRNNMFKVNIEQQDPLENDGRNNLLQVNVQDQILVDHFV